MAITHTQLSNIAADSEDSQKAVLNTGIWDEVLQMCAETKIELPMLRIGTWLIKKLAPAVPLDLSTIHLLTTVVSNVPDGGDEEVLTNTCWALVRFSKRLEEVDTWMKTIIQPLAKQILSRLETTLNRHTLPCVMILSDLVATSLVSTDEFVALDGFRVFKPIMTHPLRSVRENVFWCVANLAGKIRTLLQQLD